MCHRTQIPTFLDAEPTRARPPDPRGPSTVVLCLSSLGMNEVTGQSQATLKSKSPMQSIDRLTFVFNHPASQPTFFSSCSLAPSSIFKLRSREQRHRFSWSRFRRRFWHFELLARPCHGAPYSTTSTCRLPEPAPQPAAQPRFILHRSAPVKSQKSERKLQSTAEDETYRIAKARMA